MTTKKKSSGVRTQAHAAAKHENPRSRIRELTVRALRDRDLGRDDISDLVHEVLGGASAAVDDSVPASRRSVLRQVFDGLGEAIDSVASAGARTVKGARERAGAVADAGRPAARRIRQANSDFLLAVRSFARRASSEVGEELEALAGRARRTGKKVVGSARHTAQAADGRLVELGGETARAGASLARRAAGGIAMAASGLLEGLGEVVLPGAPARAKKKTKRSAAKSGKKKPGKKAPRKVKKKSRA